MGALTSRQNAGADEIDVSLVHAYKYPPKSGNYFGSHFIMGGERFDTPQPEAYLFGENADLNFLGSRPSPFPYPPPQANEPTKTLKSLVNMRKESLRLVRCAASGNGKGDVVSTQYSIEFIFDADAPTAITIYYFATEEISPTGVVFTSKDPRLTSSSYSYGAGANQLFCRPTHDPSHFPEEDLTFNADREVIPVAIHCVAHDPAHDTRQSQTTIAVIKKHSDGSYILKALKQKIFVDGLSYLLQEIYGIENKNHDNFKCTGGCGGSDAETEDNGSECVICMCDARDTLILPCRHLCLCNSCADSLRYQANNCPICRAPFRALLQIRALQRILPTGPATPPPPAPSSDERCDHIPAGYEGVSLLEALNGPSVPVQHNHGTPDSSNPSSIERGSRKKCRLNDTRPENDEGDDEDEEEEEDEDHSAATEGTGGGTPEEEVDSEAEKLSPLLSAVRRPGRHTSSEAVNKRREMGDSCKHRDPSAESTKHRDISMESTNRREPSVDSSNKRDVSIETNRRREPSLPIDGVKRRDENRWRTSDLTPRRASAEMSPDYQPSSSTLPPDSPVRLTGSSMADESDYYTPDDPATKSILGSAHSSDKVVESVGGLPMITS